MASQFEVLRQHLERMEGKLNQILDHLGADLDLSEEADPGPGKNPVPRKNPAATRTHVEVHTVSGDVEMVPWTEIDDRIIEAVRLSSERQTQWELYRDPNGMIRVSVDAAIAQELRTIDRSDQAPVPNVQGFDALGVDE